MAKRDSLSTLPGDVWAVRIGKLYRRQCCDCGLVHTEQVCFKGKKAVCQVARNEGGTDIARSQMTEAEWLDLRAVCNDYIRRLRRERE